MSQVVNLQKRKEYVRRKALYLVLEAIAFLLWWPIACVTIASVLGLIVSGGLWLLDGPSPFARESFVLSLLGTGIGGTASVGWFYYMRWREFSEPPAYVAPITPDTLPAEAILVRGCEEPAVMQSEVLLRAANGIETPKDELLRGSQI